ncbi:MAG: hypothetical protein WCO40_09985, partial [Thermoleophilia bacterium]
MSTGIRRWTWLSAALLAITIGIVAAACGGSSSSSSSATSAAADTSAATSAAAPATAIKMGFLSNCEGPFGPFWDATLAG